MGNRLGVGAAAFAFVDDGDGSIDYPWDRGCAGTWDDSEWGTTACDDGLDNDGDGLEDYNSMNNGFPLYPERRDPGCSTPMDYDERGSLTCDDGLDNDGDGVVDYRAAPGGDPQCLSPEDDSEWE
jgi:hypothetical protein